MTWDELAIDLLRAAKAMLDSHPRSSASRSYYAAHIALAKELRSKRYVPSLNYSTQPHREQSMLIGKYLANLGPAGIRRLRQTMSRLYTRRIDSDYVPRASVDRQMALESVRNASAILSVLRIREAI
jgi:hypothetical protein